MRTKNLRAVLLLLGHSKLESTVRYLGIEVDDALKISEQTEIQPATRCCTGNAVQPLSGIMSNAYCRPRAGVRESSLQQTFKPCPYDLAIDKDTGVGYSHYHSIG